MLLNHETCSMFVPSFYKKASHTFLQNWLFIARQIILLRDRWKHPSYLPTPRKVPMLVIVVTGKIPAVVKQPLLCSMWDEEFPCINMDRFTLLRHHWVHINEGILNHTVKSQFPKTNSTCYFVCWNTNSGPRTKKREDWTVSNCREIDHQK